MPENIHDFNGTGRVISIEYALVCTHPRPTNMPIVANKKKGTPLLATPLLIFPTQMVRNSHLAQQDRQQNSLHLTMYPGKDGHNAGLSGSENALKYVAPRKCFVPNSLEKTPENVSNREHAVQAYQLASSLYPNYEKTIHTASWFSG